MFFNLRDPSILHTIKVTHQQRKHHSTVERACEIAKSQITSAHLDPCAYILGV